MIDPSFAQRMAVLMAAGTELAAMVVLGVFAGSWLDGRLGTRPLFLAGFSILGLVLGILLLTRTLKRLEHDPDHPHPDA